MDKKKRESALEKWRKSIQFQTTDGMNVEWENLLLFSKLNPLPPLIDLNMNYDTSNKSAFSFKQQSFLPSLKYEMTVLWVMNCVDFIFYFYAWFETFPFLFSTQ